MRFNSTKFCFLAGNVIGVSETYRIILLVVFVIIDLFVVFTNVAVIFTVIKKRHHFLQKGKLLMLSLMLTDLLCGCTFVPLLIAELSRPREVVDCILSSWRVIFFSYFLSTRLLCIFFISLHTFIKTNKQNSKLDYLFERYTCTINIVALWTPGIVAILAIGFSSIKTDKILGSLTFAYFVFIVTASIVCYMLVLKAIKRAELRHETVIYKEAAKYINMVLIWFLATNVPLAIFGLVLLVYAYYPDEKKRDNLIVQQLYVICLGVTSIDAIVNPIVFIQKFGEAKKYMTECCGSIIRREQIRSKEDTIGDVTVVEVKTNLNPNYDNEGYESNETSFVKSERVSLKE